MAVPNTSTNTVDSKANQRIRATTTRTTARKPVMNKQPNYKHDKPMFPWVVVAPDGLRWLGLAMNEHQAWQFALGWPDQKEVQDHKEQLGWYASEATCTWKGKS